MRLVVVPYKGYERTISLNGGRKTGIPDYEDYATQPRSQGL